MNCINMSDKRPWIYVILVKITWVHPHMEMQLEKVVIKVIIWGKEFIRKHFWNVRVRTSKKLLFKKSKENTGKKLSKTFPELYKLSKGLQQSQELLFKKFGWISVKLVSLVDFNLSFLTYHPWKSKDLQY